ncbi:MAG: alpha/beta fold hydrolase [Betaproteobacteria bacterium]|nr:alpha/beta fold hydrolase [Betaproteobacteria bacterium]MDH4322978.1 alpha/beta fold hydrolase [Betaproteobacteria bacterium]MDH5212343.1 alpha/beta fold hydrolase [Betaproteobacteria bacterium]MDH5578951.1 alpha/beta fold hydrolase [Betaproteobacteria bacterium]
MRAVTRRETVRGPAGDIECAVDEPRAAARGIALVAHPHPLFGGTRDNKVVQTLARALVELGYAAWRPNFRGVGASEGAYDEGRGEVDDLAAVLEHLQADHPVLAGFSFGAAMQAQLAARVAAHRLVLVGLAVNHFAAPAVPAGTLLIHGENDETVPIAAVRAWAAPQRLPVIVVPGADHFFHRKLPDLRAAVTGNWT